MFTQQVIDKDGDRVDDRFQAGPGKPKRKGSGSNLRVMDSIKTVGYR